MADPSARPAPQLAADNPLPLRQRAEATLNEHEPHSLACAPHDVQALLHELQVHQIELEMQCDELQLAQEALERLRALYFDLYDLAPVGYVTVNAQGCIAEANLTAAKLFGVDRGQLVGRKMHALIEPADQDLYYFLCQHLRNPEATQSCEVRMKRSDGKLLWLHLLATAQAIVPGGATLRIVLSDVTERKSADDKLQLAASVFTQAHEGITITDTAGNITEVNDAFTRITGYSRAEVIGKNPRLLQSGRQDQAFYVALWEALTRDGYWCGEIWNRRKNGEVYAELLSITAVRDGSGTLQRYVALFLDITAIKAQDERLDRLVHYDELTGLPNRMLKTDRLHQAMALGRRSGQKLALVHIDLDGFKIINDTHGRPLGDQVLVVVAHLLQQVLREGDTLARTGGDEFAAILVDLQSINHCVPLLERLLAVVAQPMQIEGQQLQVSASLGVTFYPQAQEVEADLLMRQADQAMYQAKMAGKNRYQLFDSVQAANLNRQHADLRRLQQALKDKEFVLFYQPKVNMRTGQIIGAEALIRWQHPERGMLAPAAFLPILEDHPLAVDLGEWVIDTALTQIEQWQTMGLALPLSVNVGARQLQQPDFVARLQAALAHHPLALPGSLEIEILETSALQDITNVAQLIEDCQKMGVHFSLDDFGTGYSSLLYLKRLRVATLKIDQNFVRDMLDDPDDVAILQGIIDLAHAFKLSVIAEGVETDAHGSLLLKLGCELAQGYGIARPMPAADMPAWAAGRIAHR